MIFKMFMSLQVNLAEKGLCLLSFNLQFTYIHVKANNLAIGFIGV